MDRGHIVDPKRPKRYLSAYMHFFLERRGLVRKTRKDGRQTVALMAKAVGKMWNQMSPRQKRQYVVKAQRGKENYQTSMARYREPTQDELWRKYGLVPKRFLNAYIYFIKDRYGLYRRQNPEVDFANTGKMMGLIWRGLSDTDKHPFMDKSRLDKNRWRREMLQYKDGFFRKCLCDCCHQCLTRGKKLSRKTRGAVKVV